MLSLAFNEVPEPCWRHSLNFSTCRENKISDSRQHECDGVHDSLRHTNFEDGRSHVERACRLDCKEHRECSEQHATLYYFFSAFFNGSCMHVVGILTRSVSFHQGEWISRIACCRVHNEDKDARYDGCKVVETECMGIDKYDAENERDSNYRYEPLARDFVLHSSCHSVYYSQPRKQCEHHACNAEYCYQR